MYKTFLPISLTDEQLAQLDRLEELYHDWNRQINLISRRDIHFVRDHHILHSLCISHVLQFSPGTKILDVGTGGGLPGIPLAIAFPECQFTLIDSIGKKIYATEKIAEALSLSNVRCIQERAESETEKYDFVVSRGVMPLPGLVSLVKKNIAKDQHNALPNGLIVLKGGNLSEEIKPYRNKAEVIALSDYVNLEWYKEKYAIYLPL